MFVRGDAVLDGFADGQAEAAGVIRVFGQHIPAGFGIRAGAGNTLGAPGLHHDTAVGLLVVADLDHVDLELDTEETAGKRQGAAPLTGAGLGGDPLGTLFLVVVCLGDGRIRLVAAGRAGAFVLVENLGRGIQSFLQTVGAVQDVGLQVR